MSSPRETIAPPNFDLTDAAETTKLRPIPIMKVRKVVAPIRRTPRKETPEKEPTTPIPRIIGMNV